MRKHAIRAAVVGVTLGLLSWVAIRPSSAQTTNNNTTNTNATGETSQCNSCGSGTSGGQ